MTREEAIKILRDVHDKALFSVRNALETLIPELKESEDERMIKAILSAIRGGLDTEKFLEKHGTNYGEVEAYLEKQKEQKPAEIDEEHKVGKWFTGLIPCWIDAPSTLQPAHSYHGKNVIAIHEKNGGYRCCCVDDEKPTTFHVAEDTHLVEGWKDRKPAEWSEEDNMQLNAAIQIVSSSGHSATANWLKSLRPSWKPSKEQIDLLGKVYSWIWDDPATPAEYQDGLGDFIEQLKAL